MSDDPNMTHVGATGLAPESGVDLGDFFEEPGGNITPGWYNAEVIEGYATTKGTQFTTTDEFFKDGQRIFRLCFGVDVRGTERTLQKTWFYTPGQFDGEYLARIKSLREQHAKDKSWSKDGHGKEQNFSINLAQLSQLQKAIGFTLAKHPTSGGFLAAPYIGKKLSVRIGTGKNGYDEVTGFKAR